MKTLRLLFIISLFNNGVFGDTGEVETVSVMEGDSLTLHTDTDIRRVIAMQWMFGDKEVLIAKLYRDHDKISSYIIPDGTFTGRLKLNNQTGDLTITNIRSEDSGVYQVEIRGALVTTITFSVSVFGDTGEVKTVSVMEGDSLTLHTNVPDIKKYDLIQWVLHENSRLAKLNRAAGIFSTHDDVLDGRFKNKLQLDQTGSLTIRNIRIKHSGLYKVDISSRTHTIHQSFTVTVRDEVKTVSVMEGNSVTLHTDTELQTDDQILWRFGPDDTRIAEIYKPDKLFSTYDGDDGRFRDRLKLNDQTGDLTLTDTRTEDTGDYELKISSRRRSIQRRFIVTVSVSTGQVITYSVVAGILLLLFVAAAVGVIYFRHRFPKAKTLLGDTVSVMEGDSVILRTDLTDIQKDHVIEWHRQSDTLAVINKESTKIADGVDKKFSFDLQTGNLTISGKTENSGIYILKIIKSGKVSCKKFTVIISLDELKTVMEGESVILHSGVTEIQTDDVIEWMFGDEETLIAKIHKKNDISRTYDGNEDLFKNTLELKDQTGDLTIKNITNKHSGVYTLKTIRGGETSHRRFQVSVNYSNYRLQSRINSSYIGRSHSTPYSKEKDSVEQKAFIKRPRSATYPKMEMETKSKMEINTS